MSIATQARPGPSRGLAGAGSCCHSPPPGETAPPGEGEGPAREGGRWLKLGIALAVAGQAMVFGLGWNLYLREAGVEQALRDIGVLGYWALHGLLIAASLIVFALLGPELVRDAWRAARQWRITLEALFLLSILGAFGGSLVSSFTFTGDVYYEVVAIVLAIYAVSTRIGERSRGRALAEASRLRESLDYAATESCCGGRKRVPVGEVEPGTRVLVDPGEPFTVDGEILIGEGYVRELAMTGEPGPVRRGPGERVLAGTYSVDAAFTVRAAAGTGRELDRILQTVEEAATRPSRHQVQANRIMRIFVPFVAVVSITTFAGWLAFAPWHVALFNAMAVLLVACPCALGLATPIAVWSGLFKLSQLGVVSREAAFLDGLAEADALLFDKTGTLTEGELVHAGTVYAPGMEPAGRERLTAMVKAVEARTGNPVGRALAGGGGEPAPAADLLAVQEIRLVPGKGVEARVAGRRLAPAGGQAGGDAPAHSLRLGEADFCGGAGRFAFAGSPEGANRAKRRIHIALDGEPSAVAFLREELRPAALETFRQLRRLGLQAEILTGDPEPAWRDVAGVPVLAGLSAEAKVAHTRRLEADGRRTLFVGDGINDAAAMSEAGASVALGGGAALARTSANAVLMGDELGVLPGAIRLARNIHRTLRANLLFAAGYNLFGMGLAVAGVLHPLAAALLMLGSSTFVSIRAARAAR